MSANTGGPASEKTLRDEFAGQALTGLLASPESRMPFDVVQRLAYDHAEAMLAEKARREATGKDSLQVPDHSPDATKMLWKQSPNMGSAIVCETQFSDEHADDENVKAYGGFLVAESVPEEAKALIIRAPQLEAANRELVEALESFKHADGCYCEAAFSGPNGTQPRHSPECEKARAILAKHKGTA